MSVIDNIKAKEDNIKAQFPATLSSTTVSSNNTNQIQFQKPQTSIKQKKSKYCCINMEGCTGNKP